MKLYWKHTPDEIQWFIEMMARHPEAEFFQPSPEQAPWHVQARLPNGVLLNFWPHTGKGMIQDDPPVVLWHEVEALFDAEADDFDLIDLSDDL